MSGKFKKIFTKFFCCKSKQTSECSNVHQWENEAALTEAQKPPEASVKKGRLRRLRKGIINFFQRKKKNARVELVANSLIEEKEECVMPQEDIIVEYNPQKFYSEFLQMVQNYTLSSEGSLDPKAQESESEKSESSSETMTDVDCSNASVGVAASSTLSEENKESTESVFEIPELFPTQETEETEKHEIEIEDLPIEDTESQICSDSSQSDSASASARPHVTLIHVKEAEYANIVLSLDQKAQEWIIEPIDDTRESKSDKPIIAKEICTRPRVTLIHVKEAEERKGPVPPVILITKGKEVLYKYDLDSSSREESFPLARPVLRPYERDRKDASLPIVPAPSLSEQEDSIANDVEVGNVPVEVGERMEFSKSSILTLYIEDLIAMSANTAEKYDYIPRNAWVFEEQQISDMDLHGQKAKETEDVPPLEAFIVSESESIPKAKDVIEEREVQTPPAIPAVLSDPSSDTDKSVTPKSQKDCEEEKPQDGEDNVQEASAEKASKPRSIVQLNPVEEKEQKEESKKEIPADVVQVVKEREAQTPAAIPAVPSDPSSDTDKSVTPKSQKDCEEEKPQDGEDNVQEASAEKASKPRSIVQPNPVEEKEQKEESKKEIPADVVQVVKEREAQTPAEPSAIPPDPSPGDSNAKKPMSRDQWYAQMNEMTKEINSALKYTTLKPRIKTKIKDFNLQCELGSGGFGKVYRAKHKASRKVVAIKAIKKNELNTINDLRNVLLEQRILLLAKRTQNNFVVPLFASFNTAHHICFAMEYAQGGDLASQLSRQGISMRRTIFYSACTVLGLKFLHEHNIVHRDLKPQNILLDRYGYAKIADFGLCKEGIGYMDTITGKCGTLNYMAPEIFTDDSYTRAVDWWSLGIIIYKMLVGKAPFRAKLKEEMIDLIVKEDVEFPEGLDEDAKLLIRNLLCKEPQNRLGSSQQGATDVMRSPFFKGIDWVALSKMQLEAPHIHQRTEQRQQGRQRVHLESKNLSEPPINTFPKMLQEFEYPALIANKCAMM